MASRKGWKYNDLRPFFSSGDGSRQGEDQKSRISLSTFADLKRFNLRWQPMRLPAGQDLPKLKGLPKGPQLPMAQQLVAGSMQVG